MSMKQRSALPPLGPCASDCLTSITAQGYWKRAGWNPRSPGLAMSDKSLHVVLRLLAEVLLAVICVGISLVCILQGGPEPDEEAQL